MLVQSIKILRVKIGSQGGKRAYFLDRKIFSTQLINLSLRVSKEVTLTGPEDGHDIIKSILSLFPLSNKAMFLG